MAPGAPLCRLGPPALAIEARGRHAVSERTAEEMAMATATRSTIEAERMSLVDTAWLHMEMPTNLMMVGSLAFFDAPLDRDRLVRSLSGAFSTTRGSANASTRR